MTRYLTPEQVLFLHNRLIEETGGEHGILNMEMLLSALGRPQAIFDGKDLYTDIFTKAAALMDSLIRNHPFLDGIKRTGISAAALFIKLNSVSFKVGNSEMVSFTLACAQSQKSLQEISDWLRKHSFQ